MVNHKPLPEIPSPTTNLTTLSVDARAHRSRLLYHFLSEIHEPGIESRRDAWVNVFEDVLDEMGVCLNEGRWLTEFRKIRDLKRERRRAEREKETVAKMQREAMKPKKLPVKTQSGSGSATAPGSGPSTSETNHEHKQSSTNFSDESRTTATTTNSSANAAEKPPPTPRAMCLLLGVAPLGSPPPEDRGFALISHELRVGCTFVSGLFSQSGTTILYGSSEWASEPPS